MVLACTQFSVRPTVCGTIWVVNSHRYRTHPLSYSFQARFIFQSLQSSLWFFQPLREHFTEQKRATRQAPHFLNLGSWRRSNRKHPQHTFARLLSGLRRPHSISAAQVVSANLRSYSAPLLVFCVTFRPNA